MGIIDHVEGIVHAETQVHEDETAIDLTAAEIYEITGAGRVDFGGEPSEARRTSSDQRSDGSGELEPADLEPHERGWRNEDDDYLWGHLDAGQYVLEFTETGEVAGDATDTPDRLVLQPRDAICERGASHPTLHVEEIERIPISVGGAGLRIKENARVSTLLEP